MLRTMEAGTYWAHDAKAGNVFPYEIDKDGHVDFQGGRLLMATDFLTTGFLTREEAEAWALKWHACLTCQTVRKGPRCTICGDPLGETNVIATD